MMANLAGYLRSQGSLRQTALGVKTQWRVIMALMIRDGMSRFGHDNLGFFWVIGQPLFLTSGVMVIWSLGHATHGAVGVIPFTLTGYTYLTLWRNVVNKSVRCMTYNANLAFHNHVQFFDVLVARGLMESISIFSAFTVAYIPLWLLDYVPSIRDPLQLVLAWGLVTWFSMSFGFVLGALSELSEVIEHFIHPLMYLTMPLTGVFMMQEWLPSSAAEVLSWSPLVNGVEMFRGGLFSESVVKTQWSASYLLLCCLALTVIGVPACRYAQRHVQLL